MRQIIIIFILILLPKFEWEVAADTISYQLIGITRANRSVNGTQSDYFVHDDGGDYRSVLKVTPDAMKIVFNPEKRIMVGKPVPDFEVTLLDGKEKVSNKSLLGKFYLIDFWAVWCGPCVAEMENLHAAYQKFKDKNFTILSLSLDRKVEDITKFRKEKWKMPWLHAFMGDEVNKPVPKIFEVRAIPKPILVGFDGRIIATEVSLRGDKLGKTLADFLK